MAPRSADGREGESHLEVDKALLAADVDVRTVREGAESAEHGLERSRRHHRVVDRPHPQMAARLVPCVCR